MIEIDVTRSIAPTANAETATASRNVEVTRRNRLLVTAIEAIYMIALFALAAYVLTTGRPTSLGFLPLGVVWFGALGAVLCSFNGVFDHRNDWDPSWTPWHVTRPLIGVCLAVVSWMIFQAGVLAVGSTVPSTPNAPQLADAARPTNLLYYLIAFIVGYREAAFRDLIEKVSDVILKPGSTKSTTKSSSDTQQ